MKKYNKIVEAAFRAYPETRDSNDVLWVKIVSEMSNEMGIETTEDFFTAILNQTIPSSHTIAAAASCVRKEFPELQPTTRSQIRRAEIKQEYINTYYSI